MIDGSITHGMIGRLKRIFLTKISKNLKKPLDIDDMYGIIGTYDKPTTFFWSYNELN